jgi:hypothetical protein
MGPVPSSSYAPRVGSIDDPDRPHKERTALRPGDLRRLAARAEEPERARKMLALAERLEEKIRNTPRGRPELS